MARLAPHPKTRSFKSISAKFSFSSGRLEMSYDKLTLTEASMIDKGSQGKTQESEKYRNPELDQSWHGTNPEMSQIDKLLWWLHSLSIRFVFLL